MVKCSKCKKSTKRLPFTCRRCGRNHCSKHRLPEDHECLGLSRGNVFAKLSEQREDLKGDNLTSHYVITNCFNSAFNELIADFSKDKEYGRVRGGLHDVTLRDQHPLRWIGLKLKDLRDEFLKKEKVTSSEIISFANKIVGLAEETTYNPMLMPSVHEFLSSINKEYSANVKVAHSEFSHLTDKGKKSKFQVDDKHKKEHVGSRQRDSTKDERPPTKKSSPNLGMVVVGIFLLGMFVVILQTLQPETAKVDDVSSDNLDLDLVERNVEVKNVFEDYIDNNDDYDGKKISLTGFLERSVEGSENAGIVNQYIVDDFGNKIILLGVKDEYDILFPDSGHSEKLFLVEGVGKRRYRALDIKVPSISPAKRQYKSVVVERSKVQQKQEPAEVQENAGVENEKFLNILKRILHLEIPGCDDGTKYNQCSTKRPLFCKDQNLTTNPRLCGCPSGQREYDSECIKIIKCSDGTLHPECSVSEKMQCEDGIFVLNPECGCPDGFILKKSKCLKTCDDGTAYGYCSEDKPSFCEKGKLIEKASECGCKSGFSVYRDACMERERAIEIFIFDYTNDERKEENIRLLKWDDKLAEIARSHSVDMAENDFFSHDNLNGEEPSDRAARMGFRRTKQLGGGWFTEGIAENIGAMPTGNIQGYGYVSNAPESIAKAHVKSWMESPGHRENILDSQYTHLGVGIAYGSIGYLGTQNFW